MILSKPPKRVSKVNKAVNEDVVRKLKCQSKKVEGSRTKIDSSAKALKVSKPYVVKKKKRLHKSSDPPFAYGSDADDFDFNWSNFLNWRAYFP